MQYLLNMNEMFNDLGGLLLNNEDTDYIYDIKYYLSQVKTYRISVLKRLDVFIQK